MCKSNSGFEAEVPDRFGGGVNVVDFGVEGGVAEEGERV